VEGEADAEEEEGAAGAVDEAGGTQSMAAANASGGMLIQWHITERCNLRCAHCYQDASPGEELDYAGLLAVLGRFKEFLSGLDGRGNPRRSRAHLSVTGGEPFIRPDFMDLLQVLAENRRFFSFAILTNGSLIDEARASRLKELKPSFVQVSLDGGRSTHDSLRGPGSFDKTVSAIRLLVGKNIRTFISFTAHRDNYLEFPVVADIGNRLKVARVWADRFVPPAAGSARRCDERTPTILSPRETFDFFGLMHEAGKSKARCWLPRRKQTEIAMHRGLQFLVGGGTPYGCTAGQSLLAVLPNGDVYPCRRMPVKVGNVLRSPLMEIYSESALLRALRDRDRVCEECRGCFFVNDCRGGSKCLSYALTGDPFALDPGCWLSGRAKVFAREWMKG
jgi:radical SAM protein with 4Fe4S-binding SPASM domain